MSETVSINSILKRATYKIGFLNLSHCFISNVVVINKCYRLLWLHETSDKASVENGRHFFILIIWKWKEAICADTLTADYELKYLLKAIYQHTWHV